MKNQILIVSLLTLVIGCTKKKATIECPNGTEAKSHNTGETIVEQCEKDGKPEDGPIRFWDPEGHLIEEMTRKNGKWNGPYKKWNGTDKIVEEGVYKDNEIVKEVPPAVITAMPNLTPIPMNKVDIPVRPPIK